MNFIDWLKSQKYRGDEIGDLATDCNADINESNIKLTSYNDLKKRMISLKACPEAMKSLKIAYKEYPFKRIRQGKKEEE